MIGALTYLAGAAIAALAMALVARAVRAVRGGRARRRADLGSVSGRSVTYFERLDG